MIRRHPQLFGQVRQTRDRYDVAVVFGHGNNDVRGKRQALTLCPLLFGQHGVAQERFAAGPEIGFGLRRQRGGRRLGLGVRELGCVDPIEDQRAQDETAARKF